MFFRFLFFVYSFVNVIKVIITSCFSQVLNSWLLRFSIISQPTAVFVIHPFDKINKTASDN